ncbi:sulfatase-like hydrolase/transferase [Nocardia mexicana]|nr:sulfatase-like hydrolase/transferase [Nocardia mexicana]
MAAAPVVVPALGALRSAPAAAAVGERPNILVIMTDQERADVVVPEGFSLPTRARLEAGGVRFAMHHTPTAPCTPARSAFFTGLQAPVSGMTDNVSGNDLMGQLLASLHTSSPNLDTAIPTLGAMLRHSGYRTAYIGKWHLSDPVRPESNALAGYGFDEAYDILSGGGPNEGSQEDPGVVAHATDWLARNATGTQPWLCVVSMVNPHDMMYCPRFYRLEDVPDHGADVPPNFESDLSTKPRVQTAWRTTNEIIGGHMPGEVTSPLAQQQWRQWGNWYLELLRRTDELTGSVLDALDRGGAAHNTVVIKVADHGELGGAHGLRQKGAMIYRENNRVPLIIADPRNPGSHGRTVTALTSHIDIAPTLAALAGATPGPLPGHDLSPLLTHPAGTVRDALLLTSDAKSSAGQTPGINYCLRGALTPRYSFARYSTPEAIDGPRTAFEYELYDRDNDPLELHNLAHNGGAAALVDDMNALVDSLITAELRPLS